MTCAENHESMTGTLLGLRVLVTRPAEQAQALVEALSKAGAIPILYPTIAVDPPPSWELFDAAVVRLQSPTPAYDWIVFTSPSAVRFALDRSPSLAAALAVGRTRVASVGEETSRKLRGRGITVHLAPEDQRQEGLVAAFNVFARGLRILFPQALEGRELFRDALERLGAEVEVVPVSRTRALELPTPPPPFDVATFASPSALRAFVAGRSVEALRGKIVAAIGPTTEAAAHASGVSVDVTAPSPSIAQLIRSLGDWRRRELGWHPHP